MKINPIVGATAGAVGAVLIAKHAFKAHGTLPMILVGVGGALLGNHLAAKSQKSAFTAINDYTYRNARTARSNAYGDVRVEFDPTIGKSIPMGVITKEESPSKVFDLDLNGVGDNFDLDI
jgi:uncharacterized membrane protein YeaQ/YmgE (transglycosylase-associated protein family)